MHGRPVCLSAARLHPDKDPLTTIRGYEELLESHPEARLYLHYLSDELLPELQSYVNARPGLAGNVEFRGPLVYGKMEAVYNSADFLLQASLREYSGCAVLDAMACGVIPIVTDIPALRRITGGGRVGLLFEGGRPQQLAARIRETLSGSSTLSSAAVRRYFDEHLSFPAMAARLEAIYASLL
jgi:glycosyltransferase involved in cell wall biosynthesis